MRLHILGPLLLFASPSVFGFSCPSGFDQVLNEETCVIAITKPKYYFDAIRDCGSMGAIPAKIQNIYENSYIYALMPMETDNVAPFIGVEKKPNGNWTYADGSTLIYQNWAVGEPLSSSNSSICAIMDPFSGKWKTAECSDARPFICSINKDNYIIDGDCPDEWVYFQSNCYYFRNFTVDVNNHWLLYNFTTAENECKKADSHLASIHSKEEDDWIFDLIFSNAASMSLFSSSPCDNQWVFIGLSGNGVVDGSSWIDGTPVDYLSYPINTLSSIYYWVTANDQSCNVRRWGVNHDYEASARFLCKKPARGSLPEKPLSRKLEKHSDFSSCPAGFDQFPRENTCAISIAKGEFYYDVIRRCHALESTVVKIQNAYENTYLFALLSTELNSTSPYIGVEKKSNGTWIYADGTALTYQNWDLGEPSNSSNTSVCAIMNSYNGRWKSAECSYVRPYICSTNGADNEDKCPYDWIYFEKTGQCYYFQNFTYNEFVEWNWYNFTTAEEMCQQLDPKAHLISFHLREELDFAYDLIYSNVANMRDIAPKDQPCVYQVVWTGLYSNGRVSDGYWTDGSRVDYIGYPLPTLDSNQYLWVMGNDKSCNVRTWLHAVDSSSVATRFICKMPSKTSSDRNNT